jgi:5'-phosphate synthase pdxT subunit
LFSITIRKVRTAKDLQDLEGLVLPGGESTAMGLIGTGTTAADGKSLWEALREYSQIKPTWGTCAGMILLAEKCVGASAVIEQGQALIGGVDITVCRNYFGSQISSFEMATPPPPTETTASTASPNEAPDDDQKVKSFPGVFIRAPAILAAGADVTVLGRVHATPCRQAAVTLRELERKIESGEPIVQHFGVVDALERKEGRLEYKVVSDPVQAVDDTDTHGNVVRLPGAAPGNSARHVICAVRKQQLLCTAFHPELTGDYRWHEYFVNEMVKKA